MQSATIRIHLVDGSTEGLWYVEKGNWSGLGLVVPRAAYRRLRGRPELAGPGVYVLVGPAEDDLYQERVYIGEAEEVRRRLDAHNAAIDFWNRAVVFTSKDTNLNKAHVRYLEANLIARARGVRRAEVSNEKAQSIPAMSMADESDLRVFLDNMLLIYPIVGVRAFESAREQPETGESEELYLTGPDASGTGRELSDGFFVEAGAVARRDPTPSFSFGRRRRDSLLAEGLLQEDGASLVLKEDFVFSSPSEAAAVLLGRNANGRTEWRTRSGVTLKELQERGGE